MPAHPDLALHERLLRCAREPREAATLALAGVMTLAATRPSGYRSPIVGLSPGDWAALEARFFPGAGLALLPRDEAPRGEFDEFDDLVRLLAEHAAPQARDASTARWLAHAIATACTAANHLWQDLGLPGRGVLNQLMQEHFPALRRRNGADMKWKKFFYRCLCEQAEVLICKAPSCSACSDRALCFGAESGRVLLPPAIESVSGAQPPLAGGAGVRGVR
ncbi:nitrogen fixation protein NifQ [Caldimonas tepidiphila]|uniref:nitrogen fixation protein NifQ n=1 Tax=Caldimonas tepidiphila TaxID=2315841 RepID=UPI000E5A364C|nr:nitrogen fixation protein NifQ [Caldimonas tepidiphila]